MVTLADSNARAAFDRQLAELRPRLHRYCARMTGSVIDGEDVVQDALVKAIEAFAREAVIQQPEAWLFRIAHNAALDFLRRRARQEARGSDMDPDTIADPLPEVERRQIAAASLRTFLRLPVAQRSSVILMDVLGYSLQEIGAMTDSTVGAVKINLHRGRARLRGLAQAAGPPPMLGDAERARLSAYVERFNAGAFDALRDMLADEVRLELVNHRRMNGRTEVGTYFHNYAKAARWRFALGFVEGRPAVLARSIDNPTGPPTHFILLGWSGDRLLTIRDFLYARYVMDGAECIVAT